MEETKKSELCRQLGITDHSLLFLFAIIASTLLSFWSITLERRALCGTIQGETVTPPNVYPIRHTASSLVVGSLGFFLCLAWRAWQQSEQGDDCVAKRSARTNLWASILVLAAAMLRFNDLNFVEKSRQSALLEEEDLLPEV